MADTKVRVSQEVYDKLRAISEKSSKSMRELVEEAINAYLLGVEGAEGKDVKGITAKIIPLQFPTRCKKCGRQLQPGDLGYWAKITFTDNTVRSYTICLDCYYQGTALKEQYLKKRKLEIVVRELRREADRLAEKVEELRAYSKLIEAKRELLKLLREARELLNVITSPERRIELEKLNKSLDNLVDAADKLIQILEQYDKEMARRELKARRGGVKTWS